MIYPNLIQQFATNIECNIFLNSDTPNNFGEYEEIKLLNLKGFYKDTSKVKTDTNHTSTIIKGIVIFDGDIYKERPYISSGQVEIFGVKRNIISCSKKRNFDGTVNYTKIELE